MFIAWRKYKNEITNYFPDGTRLDAMRTDCGMITTNSRTHLEILMTPMQ